MISIAEWAPSMPYTFFVHLAERRCHGYSLPTFKGTHSSTIISKIRYRRDGVKEGTEEVSAINCVGNKDTGEGYCYSSFDGESCGQCKLWPGGKDGEVLCTDHGLPQGGPLKTANEVEPNQWEQGNTEAWEAFRVDQRLSTARNCSGKVGLSGAKFWFVQNGQLVQATQLLAIQESIGGAILTNI